MRVSYEWLSEFVDLRDITPKHAAELLTMHGVEIESVTVIDLSQILIGRVASQTPHPSSRNPLWIHTVDLGERTEQIIAGAPNAVPGSLVPVALPGTVVPNGKAVKDMKIAGVAGRGMMCSAAELMLGDDHSGIMLLEAGQPGQRLSDLYPLEAVLEAEVTSNRPDCLCHMGIARELAAAAGRQLSTDFMPPFTGGSEPAGTNLVGVAIDETALCSRYIACVITGVRVGPSPSWMQRRLRAAGVRPINNVVDITNYVLLEYGQPLHAFDLAKLEGPEIRVRRARDGESLRCLDGQVRALDAEMLVIADATRPVALAGIIGGEETAVGEGTTDVLLEAATFDGPSVRSTSRRLGLRTEASSRFEKRIPSELALAGARRAAALLSELAGGQVHRDWPDVYPVPQPPVMIRVWPAEVDALLGLHVPLEDAEGILKRLGFHIRVEEEGAWDVLAPVFRLDVAIPEDVVEEIGRIYGYDRIPATLPGSRRATWYPVTPSRPVDRIREVLAGAGFSETVTPALVPSRWFEQLDLSKGMLRVANPLSDELDATRTSLIPSLLQVAALNRSRGRPEPKLFEVGRVFLQLGDGTAQPEEPARLAGLAVTGSDSRAGVESIQRLKSAIERAAAEVSAPEPVYEPAPAPLFHPGRTAAVVIGGRRVGQIGELHPRVLAGVEISSRAAAFELDLDLLLASAGERRARSLPRYPAVERDISIVVPDEVPAASLLGTIRGVGGELLESLRAVDEYRGSQVEKGFKSVSFALTFRSPERTLTDSEVGSLLQAVLSRLERDHGSRVRA